MKHLMIGAAAAANYYKLFQPHFDKHLTRDCTASIKEGRLVYAMISCDDKDIGYGPPKGITGVYQSKTGQQLGFTVVLTPERRKGIGTELLIKRYEEYPDIVSRVSVDNVASIRMCEKAGLKRMGNITALNGKELAVFMKSKEPEKKVRPRLVKTSESRFVKLEVAGRIKEGMISGVMPTIDKTMLHVSMSTFPQFKNEMFKIPSTTKCFPMTQKDINKKLTKDVMTSVVQGYPIKSGNIGSDPEIFVVDEKGTIIPAFSFLKDKKEASVIHREHPYYDGFQAEYNPDAMGCLAYFIDGVQRGLTNVLHNAKIKNPNARLTWKSVLDIPDEVLRDSDPKFLELGCMPSKNVYPHIKPLMVADPRALQFRFAGCHIHFGMYNKHTEETATPVVKALDAIIGPLMTCILRGMEDPRRRLYYGRAGEYRIPAHGIEYRTPSSGILCHPVVAHLIFDLSRNAVQLGLSNLVPGILWRATEKDILKAINEYDIDTAEKIIKDNEHVLRTLLKRFYYSEKIVDNVFRLIYEGAMKVFNLNENSMEEVWKIKAGWIGHSDGKNCCVSKWDAKQ